MLGLYVHIPFCVKKCKYCDFNSYKMDIDSKKRYIEDLKIEMELYSNKLYNCLLYTSPSPRD